MRRTLAIALIGGALVAILIAATVVPIHRMPGFHRYADHRDWLGIPHAGDVLSNLAFLIAAAWAALRVPRVAFARAAIAGVAAIGVGSGAYHLAPSDLTLALDWAPIVVTVMIMTAAVIHDRLGERAGRVAIVAAPVMGAASVLIWIATGGTDAGGNMTPYVSLQATGVALPPLVAVLVPGAIARTPLLGAVALFVLARVLGAYDRELLDAIGISGHSLKHVAAAAAAACVLGALTSRASAAAPASS